MASTLDFGYPWWLSYAHASLALALLLVSVIAYRRRWPRWAQAGLIVIGLWAAVASIGVYRLGANRVPPLPTAQFLSSGHGRVLDIGAGTGRSAIMVLRERPEASVVALDLFGDSFTQHFGEGGRPEERLLTNLRAAGVEARATIAAGDMRALPFDDASFDAAVSAYAMDHVGGDGAHQALAEARRVVKPGGDLLLMLIANDGWMKLAFGPALSHGGARDERWWRGAAEAAGFALVEEGHTPGTLYLLLRSGA